MFFVYGCIWWCAVYCVYRIVSFILRPYIQKERRRRKNEKEMVFILHVMCSLYIRNSDEKSARLKPWIKCSLLDCSARVINSMNDSERKRAIEKRTILLIRRMCVLMWSRGKSVCVCVYTFCFVFRIRNFYWIVKKNARHFWMCARVTQRTSSLHYT